MSLFVRVKQGHFTTSLIFYLVTVALGWQQPRCQVCVVIGTMGYIILVLLKGPNTDDMHNTKV